MGKSYSQALVDLLGVSQRGESFWGAKGILGGRTGWRKGRLASGW